MNPLITGASGNLPMADQDSVNNGSAEITYKLTSDKNSCHRKEKIFIYSKLISFHVVESS